MESHHEASPLLREKRHVSEVPVVANKGLWKFAMVAVGLSALGLIATSTSMGGNFHITSFDSASATANIRGSTPINTPPLVANAPPLVSGTQGTVPVAGGPLSVVGDVTDVLASGSDASNNQNVKVPAVASTSSSSTKSLPVKPVQVADTTTATTTTTTESSTAVSTDSSSTVILPGSPNDPKLAEERAKKVEAVEEIIEAASVEEPVAVVVTVPAPVPPVVVKEPLVKEPTTDALTATTETTSTTEEKTGGKHGSKATVDIPDKPTEDGTTVGEEAKVTAVSATVETVNSDIPKYIPTAIASTDTSSNGHGIDEKIVPESLSYEFVYNKMAPNNFPFLMHYRFTDKSCTTMVAAEGYSLDVCFASKVDGKSFFQKNVAWVTTYDTGMFTYYYTDNECTNLVKDINEIKENPSVLQYRTDCYTDGDASPGKAAIVSTTDVRTLQYEKLGLPATSSVVVGNYVNDQCLVPTTFTWQRTDICYNDEMYKCDGTLGHKTSYSMGTKCSGSFKGTDLPFKIAECLDTVSYGLVSDNNFQMSNCWDVAAPPVVENVVEDVVAVEDNVASVEVEETVAENKPWWKFWA